MSGRTNGAMTPPHQLSMVVVSKLPPTYMEGKISKELESFGINLVAVLEPGKPLPPCDAVGFIQNFGSHGDEERLKKMCNKAGVKLVFLSRKAAGWRDAFKKAGINLDRPKPVLVHSQSISVPAPIPQSPASGSKVLRSIIASAAITGITSKPDESPVEEVVPAFVQPLPPVQETANDVSPVSQRETLSQNDYDEFISMQDKEIAEEKEKAAILQKTVDEQIGLLAKQAEDLASAIVREDDLAGKLAMANREIESLRSRPFPRAVESRGTDELRRTMEAFDTLVMSGAMSQEEAWVRTLESLCNDGENEMEAPAASSRPARTIQEEAARWGIFIGQRWKAKPEHTEITGRVIEVVNFIADHGGSIIPRIIVPNKAGAVRKRVSFQSLIARYELVTG